jgi:saccharopine dehydrogenase-like NADP-dependent oxidoreductase
MRQLLIIGAGRSSSSLISYLLDKSEKENILLTVADISLDLAISKTHNHPNSLAVFLDIEDANSRLKYIKSADLVISMLPARLHLYIAKDCLELSKNLVTPSYVSKEMRALDSNVKKKNLIFLNEMGVDPGIDHMSAMEEIDSIRDKKGSILLFESFTGGLVAPECDDNLWNYKFTWNPRNVVLAGQGGPAKFMQEGKYKYIPYHKLFRRTEILDIEGHGKFEAYANRSSLNYKEAYGFDDILTLYRGTIRRIGFSRAWNIFVQLGMTDDSYIIEDSAHMSYRDFTNSFLAYHPNDSVELKLRHYLKIDQDDIIWEKLLELCLFDDTKKVGLKQATPAQILEKILKESWTLKDSDRDMIVMHHLFGYELDGEKHQIESSMVCLGDDQTHTAMSKTVGLPVAIAALKILNGDISTIGVQIPIIKEIYQPILRELALNGINFTKKETPYLGYNPENVNG